MSQHGFDFDSARPGGAVPKLLSVREQKMSDWRASAAREPTGAPSNDLCAACAKPILIDDAFGLRFGEHAACFE